VNFFKREESLSLKENIRLRLVLYNMLIFWLIFDCCLCIRMLQRLLYVVFKMMHGISTTILLVIRVETL